MSAHAQPPPPTTLDHLEQHDFERPGAVALATPGHGVTYLRFFQDVMRVTAALQALGLDAPGSTVAIGHAGPYHHWLLLLARENLGLVTASFAAQEWPAQAELWQAVDQVLVDAPLDGVTRPCRVLGAAWFAQAYRLPWRQAARAPRRRGGWRSPQRLCRSSGTTAAPKLMVLSRERLEVSLQQQRTDCGFDRQTVLLWCTPFAVNWAYAAATGCLRLGATVAVGPLLATLQGLPVTHLRCLPATLVQLLQMLQQWPAGAPPQPGLHIATGGGPLPNALRERAEAILGAEASNSSGANEVGIVCWLDAAGTGVVTAGVDLKIVDLHGAELPLGEIGQIALRSPGMVDGYPQDDALTAQHFRAGWFYPGDLGRLLSPRRLALLGRADDMLNLGGLKQAPTVIEDAFLAHPLVQAAAATTVTWRDGSQALLVGLVLHLPAALAEVGRAQAALLPPLAQPLHLLALPALPCTPQGKLQRTALHALYADAPATHRLTVVQQPGQGAR